MSWGKWLWLWLSTSMLWGLRLCDEDMRCRLTWDLVVQDDMEHVLPTWEAFIDFNYKLIAMAKSSAPLPSPHLQSLGLHE